MKQNKVLNLSFNCDNGKKYSIRIQNPADNLQAAQVKQVTDGMVNNHVFDFDGQGSAYHLKSAVYTTTNRETLI